MPTHLGLFYSSITAGTLAAVTPSTTDPYFQVSGNTLIPPRETQLIAAYGGGGVGVLSPYLDYMRVVAASLGRLNYPSIVPLNGYASGSLGDLALCTMTDRPLRLAGGEGISMEAYTNTTTPVAGAIICAFNATKIPAGEAFWIRYAITATATAAVWTRLLLTAANYPVSPGSPTALPAGTYAIIGMDHWSATSVAARLMLDGVRYRPRVIGHATGASSRSHELFRKGEMGVWGYFSSRNLPDIEVFCAAGDTLHTGFLRVVRVGDVDDFPLISGSN